MKRITTIFIAWLLMVGVALAGPPMYGGPGAPASETVAGVTERCTDAEMTAGTKTDCAVTPANAKVELDKKQATLTYTLSTSTSLGTSDILVPSQNAVKTYADTKSPLAGSSSIVTVGTVTSGNVTAVVSAATTDAAGKAELATDAEAAAGTSTSVVLTPANVASFYQYQSIYVPASAMTPLATNGAVGGTTEYATNDINLDYMSFDGATEQYVGFMTPFPEGWDRSTIKAKFSWSSATGSTAGDTVEWEMLCGAISDNDTIDAALGTAQVISDTLLADNGAKMQISAATPALTVGGTPALGDMIYCKVSRNVGGTDDMTEAAWLFGAWIQVKVNAAVAAW